MEEVKDFLGVPLSVGDRIIRTAGGGHLKWFERGTVVKIDTTRDFKDYVGIISDGNSRIGWTYSERLISEKSFKIKI